MLEVVTSTLDESIQAEKFGADRIELVSGILEGGITPSFALVELVKKEVNIPCKVMIRPHGKSFIYSENDLKTMKSDILKFVEIGVDGFVFGVLDNDYNIDEKALSYLLDGIGETPVTFHKALELTKDYKKSIDVLSRYKSINSILTNFGTNDFSKDSPIISELIQYAGERSINTVLGGGINKSNIESIVKTTPAVEFHVGSALRYDNKPLCEINKELVSIFQDIIRGK